MNNIKHNTNKINKLSLDLRSNIYDVSKKYLDIAIDGIFIDEWFSQFDKNIYKDENTTIKIMDLTRAFDLYNEYETEKAWHYLGQLQSGDNSFVPILTCPDDLDLTCSVFVAEQVVNDNTIKWVRFGFLKDDIDRQNPNDIEWIDGFPKLTFERENFIQVFSQLIDDLNNFYKDQLVKPSIKIPADKPKEDWELIVDSWFH